MSTSRLGDNLKFIRGLRGLSQDLIAEQLHMSRSKYASLEAGTRTATAEDLGHIAHFTRVRMEDILNESLQEQLQFELVIACHAVTPEVFVREFSRLSDAGRRFIADQIDSMLVREREMRCRRDE